VGGVKTDWETKASLEETRANFSARSADLGVQSGLMRTRAAIWKPLKHKGDRQYMSSHC